MIARQKTRLNFPVWFFSCPCVLCAVSRMHRIQVTLFYFFNHSGACLTHFPFSVLLLHSICTLNLHTQSVHSIRTLNLHTQSVHSIHTLNPHTQSAHSIRTLNLHISAAFILCHHAPHTPPLTQILGCRFSTSARGTQKG